MQVTPGTGEGNEHHRRHYQRGTPVIVGGEGPGDINIRGGTIKASVLEVDGTLYFTMPDNAWAVDARDGHELWHYFWKTKGGTHIGNRGVGMWNNYLFMETPDDYLVSLDAKTGKERWHKMIADVDDGYFSTPAPVVVGNHVLVGTGDDIDAPGFLDSFDPETGELQWKHYTVPMEKGDPGLDTWASLMRRDTAAPKHGCRAHTIRKPTSTSLVRESHSGLYERDAGTAITSIPAPDCLNVDTGKMAWYFQTSPHDMHDYDSAQTPVLVDAMFDGKMRNWR